MNKLKLISILSLTLSGDSLITMSLMWLVIKNGGNSSFLGLFLFANTVIPYLSQILLKQNIVFKDPAKIFRNIRIIGFICSLILALLFYWYNEIFYLYICASVFTIINFLSNQFLESYFSVLVLNKKIDANHSARIQQTSLQLSVLLGSSLSGFIISLGFQNILYFNAITYLFGAIYFTKLKKNYLYNYSIYNLNTCPNSSLNIIDCEKKSPVPFYLMLIYLAILIYSFNFLLPFFIQKDKGWSAIYFGLVDALAAMGAFLSALITSKNLWIKVQLMSYPFLIFSLVAMSISNNIITSCLIACIFGFTLNSIRIRIREIILINIRTLSASVSFGRSITLINMITRSIIPLFLGIIINKQSASLLFLYLGIFAFSFFALIFLSLLFKKMSIFILIKENKL